MDLVASSTPYLPSHDGLICQLLLLQFVNQLRAHHNTTTVQEVQHCVESLKQEERRQKQLITRHEDDYSKLYADHLTLQNLYLSRGKYIENLEQSLKKYEEKISALESQVKKENSARMVCECDATLQRVLEQMNTELHEMRNCSLSDDGNINQTLATLQLLSQNQNIENDIYMLENKLSIANRTIENSTEMYTRQSRELEFERQKTHTLEEFNGQLEISLRNLREQKQNFQAELQANAELLSKKDEKLRNQDEEIKKKDTELKNKDNELIYELRRNTQLQNMLVELYKKQIDFKKQDDELLKTEKSNCSTLPQQQITVLESKLKIWENKTQEAQNRLKSCNQRMKATKEQTDKARKRISKVIEFTNQYRKYLASGNFNFAIAVYGDTEIKDMFRPSQSIFGKQMTDQQAHEEGFYCENDRYIPKCFKCDGIDDCGNRNDERGCPRSFFPPGARVAPGPNWDSANYEKIGTVLPDAESQIPGWSVVQWDDGSSTAHVMDEGESLDLQAVAGYFCGPN